jgi:hypothetical protein
LRITRGQIKPKHGSPTVKVATQTILTSKITQSPQPLPTFLYP